MNWDWTSDVLNCILTILGVHVRKRELSTRTEMTWICVNRDTLRSGASDGICIGVLTNTTNRSATFR